MRLVLLGLLAGVELLLGSVWLDGEVLLGKSGMASWIGWLGPWVLRAALGFMGVFVAFAHLRYRGALERLAMGRGVDRGLLAAHVVVLAVFGALSRRLFFEPAASELLAAAWLLCGIVAMLLLLRAFVPFGFWRDVRRVTGPLWLYALAGALLACAFGEANRRLWQHAAGLTFVLVQWLLQPVIPDLTVNPSRMLLRGHNFGVIVSPECSGLEGIGLFLVFSLVFLWLFREECRFPQAWLLLPAGVVVLYGLNAVRIASLLLIGEAGYKEIAKGGFHSQAGWIAFNGVAFAMAMTARRLPWFSRRDASPAGVEENPAAAYLLPFLAIVLASMLAQAGAGSFEWLYGIRVVGAVAVLVWYRRGYRGEDWRCGWLGVGAGVAVFGMWVGLDRVLGHGVARTMPEALRTASEGVRLAWLTVRVLAAVVTVPLAEELAFRGFGMRRMQGSAEFEQQPYRSAGWAAMLVPSLLFGVLHGSRWVEGMLAGLAFAAVARHRNRIGEAVGAHAVANALLAAYVLLWGGWEFW
ncbi:MAG: exosortase E/protease, VPEID-CTERM system [Bryobacterales bacterium]|nr:exosortase E/protease, VPEID-CTERM system [Bryobacterales bacterium]